MSTSGVKVMDGSNIRKLVDDPQLFSQYVDSKFQTLDTAHDGRLSREELEPAALAIGNALGLPPKGSSTETDHIYDEVLGEFFKGRKETITKDEFMPVLRDMLLGVADGLERDPVVLQTLSGAKLETYANSKQCEVDAVGVFGEVEKADDGKVANDSLQKAVEKVSVEKGMPPASDSNVTKNVVEPAIQSAGFGQGGQLSQEEFIKAYQQSLLSIASRMKENPITVAHTEKCFDGSSITAFLKDETVMHKTIDDVWTSLRPFKSSDGTFPRNSMRAGLDLIGPFAGLPPVGAVEEMDQVIDDSLKLVHSDEGDSLGKEEFSLDIREILGGIMLQLSGKPIVVSISVPAASDVNPDDCLQL